MSGWDWNTIYLVCFGVGLVLSLVSFFGGAMHLHIGHFRMHAHVRAGGHVSPLNGFTLMAFLCWFGGTGYLLHHANFSGASVVLVLSALSGFAGAALIFWFLAGVLMAGEKTLESADTEIVGVVGTLTSAITKNGVGSVIYSQNGARRSAAVKSDNGDAIEQGAEVIVMRYSRGIAYVRRWDEFTQGLLTETAREGAPD